MTVMAERKPGVFHLVAKSNALIFLSYRLTVVEQRIVAILASQIHPADHDFSTYYFKYSDLEALCGIERGSAIVRDLKNALAGLRSKTLRLPCVDARGGSAEMLVGWLSMAICSDEHSGGVALRLEPELKPYFLALRARFTKYGLHNIVQMQRSFSIRFYEVFKSYQRLGKVKLTLASARGIAAIADSDYKRSTDFRRHVLKPAVEEINAKTDIHVTLRRVMESRQLVGWTAKIKHQMPSGFDTSAPPPAPVEAPPPLTTLETDRLTALEKEYLRPGELDSERSADLSFLSQKKSRWETFLEEHPNQPSLFE